MPAEALAIENNLLGIALGAILGAALAIAAINLLSPWLICYLQGTRELHDPEGLRIVHRRLEQAGLPKLRVDLWPLQNLRSVNALVVGLIHVPKMFRARILISDTLLKDFTHEQIDAVVAHEVAHFAQNHLNHRIWIPFLAYLFIVFGGAAAIASAGASEGVIFAGMMTLVAIAYVFSFSVLLRRLSRAQELDADWFAIHRLGVNPALYFDTLEKMILYENPGGLSVDLGTTHPIPEERREQVRAQSEVKVAPFEKQLLAELKMPATILIIFFLMTSFVFRSPDRPQTQREPAATKPLNR